MKMLTVMYSICQWPVCCTHIITAVGKTLKIKFINYIIACNYLKFVFALFGYCTVEVEQGSNTKYSFDWP